MSFRILNIKRNVTSSLMYKTVIILTTLKYSYEEYMTHHLALLGYNCILSFPQFLHQNSSGLFVCLFENMTAAHSGSQSADVCVIVMNLSQGDVAWHGRQFVFANWSGTSQFIFDFQGASSAGADQNISVCNSINLKPVRATKRDYQPIRATKRVM